MISNQASDEEGSTSCIHDVGCRCVQADPVLAQVEVIGSLET
jgi:hypothetical protein